MVAADREDLHVGFERLQQDKVALVSSDERRRLYAACLTAAHRWRVFTLVNQIKVSRRSSVLSGALLAAGT